MLVLLASKMPTTTLVPRPFPFLFFGLCSVYIIHRSERAAKICGRPGNTYYVNDVRYVPGNKFLTGQKQSVHDLL